MTKIILAFPCMGKTYYANQHPNTALDLESSDFKAQPLMNINITTTCMMSKKGAGWFLKTEKISLA